MNQMRTKKLLLKLKKAGEVKAMEDFESAPQRSTGEW